MATKKEEVELTFEENLEKLEGIVKKTRKWRSTTR